MESAERPPAFFRSMYEPTMRVQVKSVARHGRRQMKLPFLALAHFQIMGCANGANCWVPCLYEAKRRMGMQTWVEPCSAALRFVPPRSRICQRRPKRLCQTACPFFAALRIGMARIAPNIRLYYW